MVNGCASLCMTPCRKRKTKEDKRGRSEEKRREKKTVQSAVQCIALQRRQDEKKRYKDLLMV